MGKNGVYIFVDMCSFYHFCQTDTCLSIYITKLLLKVWST